jgi:hypothetical protein
MKLLTQNSDLKKTGVWAWTLPVEAAGRNVLERLVMRNWW